MSRVSGIVKVFIAPKRYYFLQDVWGNDYFTLEHSLDAPGDHYCLFQPGTPVTFEVVTNPGVVAPSGRAINVQLDAEVELPERETSRIISWFPDRGFGFAERECGCSIFVHMRDVLSILPRSMQIGDTIIHSVTPAYNREKGFNASEIDVVIPEAEAN